jgi:hypothetical protein
METAFNHNAQLFSRLTCSYPRYSGRPDLVLLSPNYAAAAELIRPNVHLPVAGIGSRFEYHALDFDAPFSTSATTLRVNVTVLNGQASKLGLGKCECGAPQGCKPLREIRTQTDKSTRVNSALHRWALDACLC